MSDYAHQDYRAYFKLAKESEGNPKRHCIRVSYRPRAIKVGTNELSNKYVEKYKTPLYDNSQEAFAHAYGWVDFISNQTDPDKEEDSREEAYNEAGEGQKRLSFLTETSEEKPTEALNEQKDEWEATLKKAYIEGWESSKAGGGQKLIDADVDD